MDIKEIKGEKVISPEFKIAKESTEAKDPPKRRLTEREASQIIEKYIETGVIERDYRSPHGLYVKLRVPSLEVLMGVVAETDKEIYEDEEHISVDRAQMIRANNILAAYVEKLSDKDYRSLQGEEYDTVEGFHARKAMLYGKGGLNVFSAQWAIDRLDAFQAEVAEAFDAESLKNL
jgi:hypothetical protein